MTSHFAFTTSSSSHLSVIGSSRNHCKSASIYLYGFTLQLMLHNIIALCIRFPTAVIFISKFDFKSAYQRLHLRARRALQRTVTTSCLQSEPIVAIPSLRATFGGKPCPFLFSEVSESVTDLSNAIVHCKSRDPTALRPTHSELIRIP